MLVFGLAEPSTDHWELPQTRNRVSVDGGSVGVKYITLRAMAAATAAIPADQRMAFRMTEGDSAFSAWLRLRCLFLLSGKTHKEKRYKKWPNQI